MRHLLLTVSLLLALTASGQVSVRDMLKTMPDTIAPYLSENNRLDLIDFIDAGMRAEVTNALGGKTELTELTDSCFRLVLTPASSMELWLMHLHRPVFCLIRTLGTDMKESVVDYFDAEWHQLSDIKELPKGLKLLNWNEEILNKY